MGKGNDLCRSLLGTIELLNHGGLSIRYTPEVGFTMARI